MIRWIFKRLREAVVSRWVLFILSEDEVRDAVRQGAREGLREVSEVFEHLAESLKRAGDAVAIIEARKAAREH